jgi:hypothetical protein
VSSDFCPLVQEAELHLCNYRYGCIFKGGEISEKTGHISGTFISVSIDGTRPTIKKLEEIRVKQEKLRQTQTDLLILKKLSRFNYLKR